MNNNHVFRGFEKQMSLANGWLRSRVFEVGGYAPEVLADRLMQRLVEISLRPYAQIIDASRSATGASFPAPGTQIECGPAIIEIGSGRITWTLKQRLSLQLEFVLHWTYCVVAMLFPTMANSGRGPATLVYGIGDATIFQGNSDEEFVKYCRAGPLAPLRDGTRFLLLSTSQNESSATSRFTCARHPLVRLLREARLGVGGRLRLLAKHALLFLRYEWAVFRLSELSLLGKDFAYCSISSELDKRGLIESIILTCSNCGSQPLWLRALSQAEVHMVWYSQNSKPPSYVSDDLTSDYPNYRWIRTGTHWVWTHGFAAFLRGLGLDGTIEVVGPIVWQLPDFEQQPENAIEIAVFDVSPFSPDVAMQYGEISHYNDPKHMEAFLRDVLSLKREIERTFGKPVVFRLKTKRGYQAAYDKAYFALIERLDGAGAISLEHHTANIFGMISKSHLVIAYPFTSPAYIADALRVPSLYYDPTETISSQIFADPPSLMEFVAGRDGLLRATLLALSGVLTARSERSGSRPAPA